MTDEQETSHAFARSRSNAELYMEIILDKNGRQIKDGDRVLIANERLDINRLTTAEYVGSELKLRGADGKFDSAKYKTDAIWWANDTPANWLTVVDV